MVSNNLLKPIVLVFHLKSINDSAKMQSLRALSKLKRYKSSGLVSVKGNRSKKFK